MIREDAERISTRMEVLKRELENVEESAPILQLAMSTLYAREVQRLIKILNEGGHRDEAAGLIRVSQILELIFV